MKFFIAIFLMTSFYFYYSNNIGNSMLISEVKGADTFKLTFKTVGFGSNILKMQPVFRVIDNKFIYTSEQAWTFKNEKPEKPDTLNSGNFRNSSIDSILSVVEELKDSVVNKIGSYTLSGCDNYIKMSTQSSKVTFRLQMHMI